MNSRIKTILEAQLATLDEIIPKAEAALTEMLAGGIAVFELDTGVADQKVIYKNPATFKKFIEAKYSEREYILRRLTGTTITSMKVRRKP